MDKRFSNNYSNTGTDIINGLSFFLNYFQLRQSLWAVKKYNISSTSFSWTCRQKPPTINN